MSGGMTGAMTGPGQEPEVASDRRDEPPGRRCIRCGAVGTHYLTCPDLRLPSGFRLAREGERT
jgi:hypothetical protein